MTTIIQAADAADLLPLIPRMLGYTPSRSVVLVPFSDGRSVGVLRADLPPDATATADLESTASTLVGMLCRVRGADALALVVYADEPFAPGPPHRAFAEAVLAKADLCGLAAIDALCAGPTAWGSYLDDALPAGGRAPTEPAAPPAGMPVPLGDQHAGAGLPDVDADAAARVTDALALVERAAGRRPGVADGTRTADVSALDDPVALFEDALAEDPERLDAHRAALLAWCLARPALRDVALVGWSADRRLADEALEMQSRWAGGDRRLAGPASVRLCGEGPRPDTRRLTAALALTRRIAASVPADARPGPLAACAWISWALGNATHAAVYARLARDIDPDHGLAGVVLALGAAGRLPAWAFEHRAPTRRGRNVGKGRRGRRR